MGVLPIGNPTGLPPTKRPAYPGGVTRQPGRDVRTHTEGDQKAKPKTCTSVDAMPGSSCSPASSQGTGGDPNFRLQRRRDPEAKSKLALGGSRRGSHVGVLEFGHNSQERGFTDRSILAFLRQGILDGGPTCGAYARCLSLSR